MKAAKNGEEHKLEATYSSIRGHLKYANAYGLAKNLFENPITVEKITAKSKVIKVKTKTIISKQLKLFPITLISLVYYHIFYYY